MEKSQAAVRQAGGVLFRAVRDFFHDGGPNWAAAIAYYTLLSIFPLLLVAASLSTFFVAPEWAVEQITGLLGSYLPGGAEQIQDIVNNAIEVRGRVSLISLLALLWTGSRMFGVVTNALNAAYSVENYPFLKRRALEALMTGGIGLLFVLASISRYVLQGVWAQSGTRFPVDGLVYRAALLGVPALLLLVTLYLAYRYVPRREVSGRAALVGAGAAGLALVLARPVFVDYVQRFANYNLIYGPLAIVVTLVLWVWLAACILLLGGELVFQLQRTWVERAPPEPTQPPDADGAFPDTVLPQIYDILSGDERQDPGGG
ncbi:MAG: YihY/virulence factor BrkB family protein [Chloroflexota bacterium]